MDNYVVSQLAFVYAEQARVLGMQAENDQRMQLGQSMAYTYDDFAHSAKVLDDLAIKTLNGV